MSTTRNVLLAILCIVFFSVEMSAQRRPTPRRTPKPSANAAATAAAAAALAADVRKGAGKLAVQINNVTRFLYTLGGIANRIEDLDKEAQSRRVSREAAAANEENKAKVLKAIGNLRAGIAALEVEFRANPNLRKFLPTIDGITDLTGESEDLAVAGMFSEAGRPLLSLVEKLSETLAAMP